MRHTHPRGLLPLLALLLFALSPATRLHAQETTRLLREPAVNDQYITFVYAGDVWRANRDGSNPVRMTVHDGVESNPVFSPDGRFIAFTGEYDGNTDVFIVPVEGGSPIRLTFHPEPDHVRGWTLDNKVLFQTYRSNETRRYGRLYTVSTDGGLPQPLILPRAEWGSYSPDGSKIAYMPISAANYSWKRYRGGRTAPIWIFDFASHETTAIPRDNSNDTHPCWVGDKVYFLSDREFTTNVFAYDTKSGTIEKVTDFSDFDVKSMSTDGKTIAFSQAGYVHLLDPATGKEHIVPVNIDPDLPNTRPHFENVGKQIRTFAISPTGVRGLFEARGDIFTVPADKGDIRDLTQSSGANDRFPAWSPKGDRIAYLSDATGEYNLYLVDQKGENAPERISLGDTTFYYGPTWSPDGEKILYWNGGLDMFYMSLKDRKPILVDRDGEGAGNFMPAWSPDSRWIAYTKTLQNHYRAVYVFDTESGDTHQLTDGMSDAVSAVFSRDGKYLYFAASTNYALNISGLDMSSYERPVRRSLYAIVLKSDTPSPFAPESDEEAVKKDDDGKKDKKDEDAKDDEVKVAIDFAGISQRIIALPEGARNYANLQTAADGNLFYMVYPEGDDPNVLRRFDLKKREGSDFLSGVRGYEISADGKKLIYSANGSTYGIVETSANNPSVGDGKLDVSGMEMRIDPRTEWNQMYNEAWRIERDFFYDPNMNGADWPAVKEKYAPLLPYIGDRDDLNHLFADMIGELVVGHAYVWGGDTPDVEKVNVGLLGADYTIDDGTYRIAKIYTGQNWNPDLTAPLTQPGIDVHEGDYLLAVNGQDLGGDDNIYSHFQNQAGKQVTLLVNDKPSTKGAREITVVPVSSERGLRLFNWVEGNRAKVDEATNGEVAYVYLPNTGGDGYEFFNRYYFAQLDKHAVIIDERFNGGGSVADYMIDLMSRPLINWWGTRDSVYTSSPYASLHGPKVMLINQNAGSGGDWLPFAFRERKLGKLIGKRTWGGLVGIGGTPSLVDGGTVTAPNFGIISKDGKWIIEDQGVTPDIDVEQTPKDVIAGQDPQLDKAIEVIRQELENYTPPTPNPDPKPTRAAPWE